MSELAKIRRSKGFSQRGLAEAARVSPSSIYEIENSRRKANPSTLRKLAGALGVEVVDLLEEEERPKATALPSLAEWLEERCGHAYLAMNKDELEETFAQVPENDPRRRELGLAINREYNTFCDFPNNVTPEERIAMRRMIRDAIPSVAVKHDIALGESGLWAEYREELARIFEVERATESETA